MGLLEPTRFMQYSLFPYYLRMLSTKPITTKIEHYS